MNVGDFLKKNINLLKGQVEKIGILFKKNIIRRNNYENVIKYTNGA